MEYIFFVDFDGTITIKDTCEMLIERNEQPGLKEINELWERKELSTPECAELLIKRMKLSKIDIDALVQEVEIGAPRGITAAAPTFSNSLATIKSGLMYGNT